MSEAAGTNATDGAPTTPRPAFMVGITGTRRLDFTNTPEAARTAAEAALTVVFRWLKGIDWPTHAPRDDPELASAFASLGESPHFKHTPLHVYSPLAPGADRLVAGVARDFGCELFAPLPFDVASYLNSSTFRDEDGSILKGPRDFAAKLLEELEREGRAFPVQTADDVDLGVDEFLQRLQSDVNDTRQRRLRYRAVGEYVAGHSHLLIALTCDPVGEDPVCDAFPMSLVADDLAAGAEAIVKVKRLGLTPGLLARSAKVNWPDLGPVIHIHTPIGAARTAGETAASRITVLFPYDAKPMGEIGSLDSVWQARGRNAFRRVAANLEEFNASAAIDSTRESSEALNLTDGCLELPDGVGPRPDAGRERCQESEVLNRLAHVRRRAAELSGNYDRLSSCVLKCLFGLTFGGAFLLHLGWYWHESHDDGQDGDGITRTAAVAGLVCFLAAYAIYRWFKQTGREQMRHDARALAEGLRVQFYWGFAGIGRSVPANYMDRQRGELDWIRQAIRSLAAPYYRFRIWFLNLDRVTQLQRLRCVKDNWIDGQRNYYDLESTRQDHQLHVHHRLGFGIAAAGVVASLIALLFAAGLHDKSSAVLDDVVFVGGTFGLIGGMFVAWAEKRLLAEHARQYHEMASLFHAASRRLQGHLAAAELALEAAEHQRFDDHVQAMQQLLYDVGLQVLNENAEWLILHRARPLEPVLAG